MILSGCGSHRSDVDQAVAEIRAAGAESRLARDLSNGASTYRLQVDTREFIDAVKDAGWSHTKVRAEFDSFSYIGDYCGRCSEMLTDAR